MFSYNFNIFVQFLFFSFCVLLGFFMFLNPGYWNFVYEYKSLNKSCVEKNTYHIVF